MVLASKGPKIVLVLDAIFENFDFWTFPASRFRIITVFCYLFSRIYKQKLSQIQEGSEQWKNTVSDYQNVSVI